MKIVPPSRNRLKSQIILLILLSVHHFILFPNGNWIQKNELRGSSRDGAVGFTIGNRGYIGTGYDRGYRNDFWEYNPDTDTWSQKAVFAGGSRRGAVGFSIGNRGYIGTGYNDSWKRDFWEYNPSTNNWTQKANFEGTPRESAVGFSIDNKGYIGTGWEGENLGDFWEYNPSTNQWTRKADFGGTPRSAAIGFSIDNKGYIGTGYDGEWKRDFWEYDPLSNAWNRKADFGGTERLAAVGFSIGDKGYIGTGLSADWAGKERDFWEYDPSLNSWTQSTNFGGITRFSAVGFSVGAKGYVGTGWVGSTQRDFWEFIPQEVPPGNENLIIVSPGTKNYGVVVEGFSSEYIFIIENPHNTEISGQITLAGPSADQYTIADGKEYFTLGPKESSQVKVIFEPLSPGVKEAIFNVKPDATDISSQVEVLLSGKSIHVDYAANLIVSDANDNELYLTFGTTDAEFALNYDQFAPPAPSPGSFDARFRNDDNDYISDLRYTTQTKNIWNLLFQSSSGGYPIVLRWDPELLDTKGRFRLVDAKNGEENVNVDMRTNNSFTVPDPSIEELYVIHSILETHNVVNRSGWNLIGLPLNPEMNDYSSLFPNSMAGTLYHFDGVYRQSETLETGRGYWLRFTDNGEAALQGEYISEIEIELTPGWNIISGASDKTSVAAIEDPNDILMSGTVYGFAGTYYQVSELEPGEGYWVRASDKGTIRIVGGNIIQEPLTKITGGRIETMNNFNKLVFTMKNDIETVLYFGNKLGEDIKIDQYGLPPVSPEAEFDVRFSDQRYLREDHEGKILLQSKNQEVTVEFVPSMENESRTYILYELIDGEVVREVFLNGKLELSLFSTDINGLQVLPFDQVDGGMPPQYSLSQNYPNPFNPTTKIQYALPAGTYVKLEVFNMLGQRIDVLVDDFQEAGYYEVSFVAGTLPSGVYVYRLRTDNFVDMKRLILVK